MAGNAQLILDEELFHQALATLAELEDRGERFELVNVVRDFTATPCVEARFADDVGREIGADIREAIHYYVGAIYLVSHRKANLQDLAQVVDEFEGFALDFIRTAAWAFVQAWVLRYGGLFGRLRVSDTLIDPRRNDPTA